MSAQVNPEIEKMSNLITNMIINGNSQEEISKEVDRSMIVIDSERGTK